MEIVEKLKLLEELVCLICNKSYETAEDLKEHYDEHTIEELKESMLTVNIDENIRTKV